MTVVAAPRLATCGGVITASPRSRRSVAVHLLFTARDAPRTSSCAEDESVVEISQRSGRHPSLSQKDDHRGDVAGNVRMELTGADVRDRVIEQLSAVRLTLRGVEGALSGGPLAGRLRDSIAELDHVTEQLRGAERPDSQVAPTETRASPVACSRW
jgi:hypothetical protein